MTSEDTDRRSLPTGHRDGTWIVPITDDPSGHRPIHVGHAALRSECADDLFWQRGRRGRRAHHPGRDEPGTVPCRQPQHQISLAEIGEDPPGFGECRQPHDVGIGRIGALARDAFEAAHALQATLPGVSNRTFVAVIAGILVAALLVSVITLFI